VRIGSIDDARRGKDLCLTCIELHSATHPGHALVPLRHTPDARTLRGRLGDAATSTVSGCAAALGVISERASMGAAAAEGAPGATAPFTAPLVACARHKAVAVADEYEALGLYQERALLQATENRDAAVAAVLARFHAVTTDILASVEAKRGALAVEVAAADAALDFALTSTSSCREVS